MEKGRTENETESVCRCVRQGNVAAMRGRLLKKENRTIGRTTRAIRYAKGGARRQCSMAKACSAGRDGGMVCSGDLPVESVGDQSRMATQTASKCRAGLRCRVVGESSAASNRCRISSV